MSAVSAGEGISIREFARRDGCSDKLVRRAISTGHLTVFDDGKLDPGLVGSGWRKTNRKNVRTQCGQTEESADISVHEDETLSEAAERIVVASGAIHSQIEAERIKENYLALLRQLEYDTKAALVVPVAQVAGAVANDYSKVRTRLLSIPSEQAPRLHRLKTVAEVQDALMEVIVEALEELSKDAGAVAIPA